MYKGLFRLIMVLIFASQTIAIYSQCIDSLGWAGTPVIPLQDFTDPGKWHPNFNHNTGDTCYITNDNSNPDAICLHWRFNTGSTGKYAQMYYVFDYPISLSDKDIFGFDIKGQKINDNCYHELNVKLKFENSTGDSNAVFDEWHNLARIERWCENVSVLKNQLKISKAIKWNRVRVVSLEVFSNSAIVSPIEGVVCFRKLKTDTAARWTRAGNFVTLGNPSTELDGIKKIALDTIYNRQAANGLLYTWREDGSSWLYGQGLALKILSLNGSWTAASGDSLLYRTAATKLATFLNHHQDVKGFWPRAWHTQSGEILQNLEGDGSVWLGDFPWIITGLQNYYKKSCDVNAMIAIEKARHFLTDSLIDNNGKLYTLKKTGQKYTKQEVTSVEAYTAVILGFLEINEKTRAISMANYIDGLTWDHTLKYWKEYIGGNRVVLFANTWFAQLIKNNQAISAEIDPTLQKSKDALSFVARVLNTKGPGSPIGFDGIGPIATWLEGSFTYICAGGQANQCVFDSVVNYIKPSYAVPHYNDVVSCGTGDIWAVKWISLDGTSWLYFAASKSSPFVLSSDSCNHTAVNPVYVDESFSIYPNPANDKITIEKARITRVCNLSIYNIHGAELIKQQIRGSKTQLDISNLAPGTYFVRLITDNTVKVIKIIKE